MSSTISVRGCPVFYKMINFDDRIKGRQQIFFKTTSSKLSLWSMEISHLVYKRFPTLVHLKRFQKNTAAENIFTVRLCFFVWELESVGLSPAFPSSWDSPSPLARCLPQKSHFWNQVSGCKSPWTTLLRSTRKRNAFTWSDGICRSGQYSPPYRKPRNSLFSHTCSNMLNWLLTLDGN